MYVHTGKEGERKRIKVPEETGDSIQQKEAVWSYVIFSFVNLFQPNPT
jgi:hypothetical protein